MAASHCSKCSPFGDNGGHYGSVEAQSLRNGFVTLSRLIYFNSVFPHLFWNFL
uniref:Uncharacterized protein n=1 Tax=Anguilla anguilla TaxID=7936 RepID=A0A0E9TKM1_ANGAN